MRRALTLVTGPASEPVTLAEFKLWAKIDTDDDDPLITALLVAARQGAEEFTRRAFVTQTWKVAIDTGSNRWADNLPAGIYDLPVSILNGSLPTAVELPRQPIQSITSVVTYGTDNTSSTCSASSYALIGSRMVLTSTATWPSSLRTVGAVEITYVAGYGLAASVPQAIRTAILMHAQTMYDERTTCDMPGSCETLLRNYRILDSLR